MTINPFIVPFGAPLHFNATPLETKKMTNVKAQMSNVCQRLQFPLDSFFSAVFSNLVIVILFVIGILKFDIL
ncbi:MAG: hypothetical protein DRG82_04520 [Deltaproteobacteria bacterium]|nr:MAG: hypothetical protein DRG82_04520 [Deltaproteobacteria bacterium]